MGNVCTSKSSEKGAPSIILIHLKNVLLVPPILPNVLKMQLEDLTSRISELLILLVHLERLLAIALYSDDTNELLPAY